MEKYGIEAASATLTGCSAVTRSPEVRAVLEGTAIRALMRGIYGEEPRTFSTKWVRVMGPREGTDAHSDGYFFNALDNPFMCTVWTPLGDVPLTKGGLAVCAGSHRLPRKDYEEHREDELPRSFGDFVERCPDAWLSANYRAGDVLVFDVKTVHGSPPNETNSSRASSDTRWQPASYFRTNLQGK
jgi:ectoine hydroxylase-related dioxygenase (phytanoyl-CoA dioxygenase family)